MNGKHYTFHLLGLTHLPCSEEYMACAFTQKNFKLASMLKKLGHSVIYYGAEGSTVECDQFIETHTIKDIRQAWGDKGNNIGIGYDWKAYEFRHDFNTSRKPVTMKMYDKCISVINKTKAPDDFLLMSQGSYHKPIADSVKLYLTCEPGIGYRGSYAPFRAFESSYIMHFTYGSAHPFKGINGGYYDRIIPNYFDPSMFSISNQKGNYFLYIGRIIRRKGIETAAKVCNWLGVKLIIAGQGGIVRPDGSLTPIEDPDFVLPKGTWEYYGYADPEQRTKLMSEALGTFVPTIYLEPFAGTHIESMLCGTPVFTTSFGVFPETITWHIDALGGAQGKPRYVGAKCNTLKDFAMAATNAIENPPDPEFIRRYAMRFSTDNIAKDYQRWFEDLHQVWQSAYNTSIKGWHWLPGDKTIYDLE